MKKLSWFLFLALFAVSCLDDPDCYQLNNDRIGISFGVMGSSAADSLSVQSIVVNGVSEFEGDSKIAFYSIAADRKSGSSIIEFKTGSETKIIDLSYQVQVQFVSKECGPRYILSNLNVNNHNFDRLDLLNLSPGRDPNSLHIKIYRCPHPDTIGINFYELTLPKTGKTSSRGATVELNGITVDGSAKGYEGSTVTYVELPINTSDTITQFDFDFKDDYGYATPVRKLALHYDVLAETRYPVCGQQVFVEAVRNLGDLTTFDSVSFDKREETVLTDPISSNVKLYRCPPTNNLQIQFVEPGTTNPKAIDVVSVTNNYNSDVYYTDMRTSRIVVPLNAAATSTQFTIQHTGGTETVLLNYTWSNPRPELFKPGSACSGRQVIVDLSETGNERATVVERSVLFPAVTNVTLEIP